MAAIEVTGTVDENRHLCLDGELPITGPARVRVIILYPYGAVLVPFPTDDLSATKARPAVCLAGPIGEHRSYTTPVLPAASGLVPVREARRTTWPLPSGPERRA